MGLALSTSWNAFRFNEVKPMVAEIVKCGFREVELSFNLPALMTQEIEKLVRNKEITVTSVHNFCPIPEGVERIMALPDYYSMSSLSESERALSVKYTKATIDTACALNAKVVVLHTGRVDVPERTIELIALYRRGLKGTAEYEELKGDLVREREQVSEKFLERALKSLEELCRYAQGKGISLGIENRFYWREIPTIKEIGIIFSKLNCPNIFYWHDTGHAQVSENLGLAAHAQYLEFYSGKMAGMHLHDVSGCDDHLAPFKGKLDFGSLKKYLKKDTIKVVEAHHPATARDLMNARKKLEALYDEKSHN